MESSYSSPTTKPIYKGTQVVWYLLGIIETLLVIRFILKMLGANPTAGFSSFIYNVTSPMAAPFLRVFNVTKVDANIFEWTTLLAMLVFWLLALAIVKLFFISKTVSTPEAAQKLNEGEKN